jgi:hypothetical protein
MPTSALCLGGEGLTWHEPDRPVGAVGRVCHHEHDIEIRPCAERFTSDVGENEAALHCRCVSRPTLDLDSECSHAVAAMEDEVHALIIDKCRRDVQLSAAGESLSWRRRAAPTHGQCRRSRHVVNDVAPRNASSLQERLTAGGRATAPDHGHLVESPAESAFGVRSVLSNGWFARAPRGPVGLRR